MEEKTFEPLLPSVYAPAAVAGTTDWDEMNRAIIAVEEKMAAIKQLFERLYPPAAD